ncbi:hypothetical protein CYY_000831 [Polysphondylium violaceum]|uniref:Uncharacterized protein n=1 Tax=Polysphondylium violaceum TaxID=133409 RepID=A0A8J4Q2X3_9MYCE|nr:hypothetical protein CYY_000831 [Polysphondylium violaceum]
MSPQPQPSLDMSNDQIRSSNVFNRSSRLKSIPWLPIWSIMMNAIIFSITLILLCLFWNSQCNLSITFSVIYLIFFLGNLFFGFYYHFRFTKGIPTSERKRNIIFGNFIVFIAASVALFILTEFIKEGDSCPRKVDFKNLIRSCGIIDLIYLGGLLFFLIVNICSLSNLDRKQRKSQERELKNSVNLKKPNDNVHNIHEYAGTSSA